MKMNEKKRRLITQTLAESSNILLKKYKERENIKSQMAKEKRRRASKQRKIRGGRNQAQSNFMTSPIRSTSSGSQKDASALGSFHL